MSREPIRHHRSFQTKQMPARLLWGIRRRFHLLSPCDGHVAHALRTLPPVAARCIATPAMPLDLHVLSLPLAFILSQDQTLLCILSYFSKSAPDTSISKKSTLSILYFNRYLLVLPSVLSMIFSVPRVWGLQRYTLFLYFQTFFNKKIDYFFAEFFKSLAFNS